MLTSISQKGNSPTTSDKYVLSVNMTCSEVCWVLLGNMHCVEQTQKLYICIRIQSQTLWSHVRKMKRIQNIKVKTVWKNFGCVNFSLWWQKIQKRITEERLTVGYGFRDFRTGGFTSFRTVVRKYIMIERHERKKALK